MIFPFFVFSTYHRPEFSYRAGLSSTPEGTSGGAVSSPGASTVSTSGSGGAPNRPLPPTPDDDESPGERTLVLRKVSVTISVECNSSF